MGGVANFIGSIFGMDDDDDNYNDHGWRNWNQESERQRIENEKKNEELQKTLENLQNTMMQQKKETANAENALRNQINALEQDKLQKENALKNLAECNQAIQREAEKIKEESRYKYQQYDQTIKSLKEEQTKDIERINNEMILQNKLHAEALEGLQKDHKNNIKKLQKGSLLQHIDNLKKEKQQKVFYYEEKKITEEKIRKEYMGIKEQVDKEEGRLKKYFDAELNNPDIKQIVLMGVTGNGKSTFGNRLCNDNSEDGNEGPFRVSDDVKSETQEISKVVATNTLFQQILSIVDTPGYYDSYNNDRSHCNNLVEFLRGCGGVNAFCIVKMIQPRRFDTTYQNMMKDLEKMLGRSVWSHIVLVVTYVEARSKKNFSDWSKNLVDEVRETMKLNEYEAPLPIIGLSNLSGYEDSIGELLNCIPSEKYRCDELRSPLDILKIDMNSVKINLDEITNRLQLLHNEIEGLEQAIHDATEQYNTL